MGGHINNVRRSGQLPLYRSGSLLSFCHGVWALHCSCSQRLLWKSPCLRQVEGTTPMYPASRSHDCYCSRKLSSVSLSLPLTGTVWKLKMACHFAFKYFSTHLLRIRIFSSQPQHHYHTKTKVNPVILPTIRAVSPLVPVVFHSHEFGFVFKPGWTTF